jgi:molybdate transport system substrate-binding protein
MNSAPLKLLSSMATRELLVELTARYAREHGESVSAEAGGGVAIAKRVQADEPCDVVVLAANVIDQLTGLGKLLDSSRVDLVRSGVGIAIRRGTKRPDIADEAAVRQAVLDAARVSYSTGPSGVYLEQLFARWDILAQIQPRIVVAPPGVPVGSLLARGECDLGFQQLSELLTLPGIDVVGPLPPSIQLMTTFSGAVSAQSTTPQRAGRLLSYLAAPATTEAKHRFGMDPA